MSRAALLVAAAVVVWTGCVPVEDPARPPRSTLMIGIDVSGSFLNSGRYDKAIRFAAHYIEAHMNGFGGLQVPTDVFVGSVGGSHQGEAKTFHPIHDFLNKDRVQIEQDLREWFPSGDGLTDFNTFFSQAADLVNQRGLTLAPLNQFVPIGTDPPQTTPRVLYHQYPRICQDITGRGFKGMRDFEASRTAQGSVGVTGNVSPARRVPLERVPDPSASSRASSSVKR